MSKFTHNTEDWELKAYLDWRPKYHTVECDYCGGRGTVGGGFKDIDGERQCPTCYGRGSVDCAPATEKPQIPEALIEHMRRAWWDYHNPKE